MNTIYLALKIKAKPEAVFKAITEPIHLIRWWPLECKGIPKENETYNFFFTPEYDWFGKVVKIVPNTCFHVKMTKADSDWNPTTFGFNLKSEKEAVWLEFFHSGWQECNSHFKKCGYSWALLLHALKQYVEHEIIIPFKERA